MGCPGSSSGLSWVPSCICLWLAAGQLAWLLHVWVLGSAPCGLSSSSRLVRMKAQQDSKRESWRHNFLDAWACYCHAVTSLHSVDHPLFKQILGTVKNGGHYCNQSLTDVFYVTGGSWRRWIFFIKPTYLMMLSDYKIFLLQSSLISSPDQKLQFPCWLHLSWHFSPC